MSNGGEGGGGRGYLKYDISDMLEKFTSSSSILFPRTEGMFVW